MGSVKVHLRPIAFDNLPDDLNGLRILHLSDLHLRHYFTLSDLESTLTEIEPHHPDLVVITGDIADDLRLLGDCIKLIDQLNPRLGTFACLGNHEYFRGPAEVHRTFAASPVPLFVNQATTVSVGKTEVLIGGIDDPRRMGAKETEFFQRSIDKTLDGLPTTPFSILMSHRPDALDYASVVGIDLTLAGHTHGGQLGLAGQSALESIWPDRYLWGHYQKSKSHLYTSSGMGHWFPFRLGCPAEAPIIELTKV